MKRGKQPVIRSSYRGLDKDSQAEDPRTHRLLFPSLCFSSSLVAVHRRSVHRHSQVLRLVHLLHCVPSQHLHFRKRIDGVGVDGGRDRIPGLNQSLRKTLLKMTLQTSWLYGIYSRLVPPQARPILANVSQRILHIRSKDGTYSWRTSCPCSHYLQRLLSRLQQVWTWDHL